MKQKRKRALMVAYFFPPLSGSGVFRSLKFAKYLPYYNYRPTVISADAPPLGWDYSDETQLKEIPKDIKIVRIKDELNYAPGAKVHITHAENALKFLLFALNYYPEAKKIFDYLYADRNNFTELLKFPCKSLVWARDVAAYLENREDLSDFDLIYTTSGPYSAHLVGFYLHQTKNIPWVADYRDEWTFNHITKPDPNSPVDRMLFGLEGVMLNFADCNITVSEMSVPNYENHFGLKGDENIVCITNGYDEEDFADFPQICKKNKRFTLNYSGLIYGGESIAPIMKAIKELIDENKVSPDEICFSFLGSSEEDLDEVAESFNLKSILRCKAYSPHREAIEASVNADINVVLLGGDDETHKKVVTGKIFEYLRSGRPILTIGSKGGVVDNMLGESGLGEVFLSVDTEGIKNFIYREYKLYKVGENLVRRYSPAIKKFERKFLTEKLAKVFDRVCGDKS